MAALIYRGPQQTNTNPFEGVCLYFFLSFRNIIFSVSASLIVHYAETPFSLNLPTTAALTVSSPEDLDHKAPSRDPKHDDVCITSGCVLAGKISQQIPLWPTLVRTNG